MASTRKARKDAIADRETSLRDERLRLIKRRHNELIVKPRQGLLDGFEDDADILGEFDDSEDYQIMESFGIPVD